MTTFIYERLETPLGSMVLVADEQGLCRAEFQDGRNAVHLSPEWRHMPNAFRTHRAQLLAYFAGELTQFEFPLAPKGTAFQQEVWQALLKIPYGQTRSYQQQAVEIQRPKAVRAVGHANGRNPLAIIIPCHRILGSNGKLTGYAGGLERKAALLQLEGALGE